MSSIVSGSAIGGLPLNAPPRVSVPPIVSGPPIVSMDSDDDAPRPFKEVSRNET